MKPLLLILACCISTIVLAQAPPYTIKHFIREHDTTEFKPVIVKTGTVKTYLQSNVSFFDVDDNNSTHIRGSIPALIFVESQYKNGKRNGITRQYLIDSFDHKKMYLIAEQMYENDKLNGRWDVYNLKGTLVMFQNFRNDSLSGLSRQYWIDGKTIMSEADYVSKNNYKQREFFQNGKVSMEFTMVDNTQNGEVKEYYETGVLKDKFNVKNGMRDGTRVYYYPDGKPWIEQIFKNNKPWTIVANYDSKGNKRNAGTLKDGNGTVYFYDDDTTVREIVKYVNGEEQK